MPEGSTGESGGPASGKLPRGEAEGAWPAGGRWLQGETPDKSQAGIKIARRNINNLRNADDIILMAESEEELKASL